jgi:hypothetical protein
MKEALKLALEALERSVATCFDQYAHHQVMSQPSHFINQAITAIKAALAQPTSGDYALGYAEGFNDACKPQPAPAQTDSFQFDIDEDVQLLMDRDMGDN